MLNGEEILKLWLFSPNTDRLQVADFVLPFPPPSSDLNHEAKGNLAFITIIEL